MSSVRTNHILVRPEAVRPYVGNANADHGDFVTTESVAIGYVYPVLFRRKRID